MIKLLIKTALFTLLLCSFTLFAHAQIGYDYAQYDLGLGGNINRVYGDAETVKSTPSAHISFTYNYTPYVNYVVEGQGGLLEGGDVNSKSGRYFRNLYKAIVFRGQLQAGEFLHYSDNQFFNALKNLYVSAGLGYIMNDMRSINRESFQVADYVTPGEDKSSELFLPVRIGYEFKFFNQYNEPSFKVDIGGTYNHDFGDGLDGFNAGKSKDYFIQYGITLKFAIGGVTSASKKISY